MSISFAEFLSKMEELSNLTGQPIRKDTVKALHQRLHHSDIFDFQKAIDSLANTDEKVNMHNLSKHINRHMGDRLEKENADLKAQEEIQAKAFWRANYRDGNCSRNCKSCPAQFCNHVANESIKAMKRILNKEVAWESACQELADLFPGVGFEKEVPAMQPF